MNIIDEYKLILPTNSVGLHIKDGDKTYFFPFLLERANISKSQAYDMFHGNSLEICMKNLIDIGNRVEMAKNRDRQIDSILS